MKLPRHIAAWAKEKCTEYFGYTNTGWTSLGTLRLVIGMAMFQWS